jgi:membrane protein implicated in regulation of membrane protease activity
VVELVILLFVVLAVACFGLLLPFLRLAVGIVILAASCLLTFALCRAATRRDMLEARWREESAGSVSEESHESA